MMESFVDEMEEISAEIAGNIAAASAIQNVTVGCCDMETAREYMNGLAFILLYMRRLNNRMNDTINRIVQK